MNKNIQMIALDLDGTLTNSNKEITPKTKAALMKAQEQGIRLILASGRPVHGIMPLAKELELEKHNGYILSFNGGKIINCETEEIVFEQALEMDQYFKVFDVLKPFMHNMSLMTYENNSIITETPNDKYVKEEAWINKISIKQVMSLEDYIYFPVVKFLGGGEPEYMAQIEPIVKEGLGAGFDVYRSMPYFLEILSEGIDKAASLDRMFAKLGLSSENLMAFGDGFNDLTMLKYAGCGVAMENAVDAVKEVADYVTKSNNEDGIAYALEELLGIG